MPHMSSALVLCLNIHTTPHPNNQLMPSAYLWRPFYTNTALLMTIHPDTHHTNQIHQHVSLPCTTACSDFFLPVWFDWAKKEFWGFTSCSQLFPQCFSTAVLSILGYGWRVSFISLWWKADRIRISARHIIRSLQHWWIGGKIIKKYWKNLSIAAAAAVL